MSESIREAAEGFVRQSTQELLKSLQEPSILECRELNAKYQCLHIARLIFAEYGLYTMWMPNLLDCRTLHNFRTLGHFNALET